MFALKYDIWGEITRLLVRRIRYTKGVFHCYFVAQGLQTHSSMELQWGIEKLRNIEEYVISWFVIARFNCTAYSTDFRNSHDLCYKWSTLYHQSTRFCKYVLCAI